MKIRNLGALALAITLAVGGSANAAMAAPQTPPSGDHSSNTGQAISDAWITTKVKSELATTKGIKSADVSVKPVDGVVILIGVLPTRTAVEKTVAVAKSIKSVKDVDASGLKVK